MGECGEPVRYITPAGTGGEVPCDLAPQHDGEHDSGELFLRPSETIRFAGFFPETL